MDALFAVQDEDTAADRIRHRLGHLPERADLEAARARRQSVENEREVSGAERIELDRRLRRAEGEVDAVAARITELEEMLYGSGMTSPKEAREVQAEVGRLRPRQDDLEERVLEVLEELDPVDARLADLTDRAAAEDARIATAEVALADAESSLRADLAQAEERRTDAAAEVPADGLARYERLRRTFGSSTVARFDGSDCRGCPSSMPAVEVDRLKHLDAGTLTDCSECGRLVVR